jgi:hypothetical protein
MEDSADDRGRRRLPHVRIVLRWAIGLVGLGLLLGFAGTIVRLQADPPSQMLTYRGLKARIPPEARPSRTGTLYVDVPPTYVATLFLSPITGGLYLEWPSGSRVTALGTGYSDGYADWELVRDPTGNEGWLAAALLNERFTAAIPPAPGDQHYLSAVWWAGEIAYCVNPSGGPPGLDGDAFLALVDRAAQHWQEVAEGRLPLASRGRCDTSPDARADGVNTIGWIDDLGWVIAAQVRRNAEHGIIGETDIRLSRSYFTRLTLHDPTKQLEPCVFSTVVHELGHLLGLDVPRARSLPSSMQAVGASRCDKGQPTDFDKANLLRRYAQAGAALP